MNLLALIPARYASTRFPGKPLVKIGKKSMIQHVYERVVSCFPNVFIATDHELIAEEVNRFGGKYICTATTHKSGTERCAEAVAKIELQENCKFDAVINIQGDEPFIFAEQLLQLAALLETPQTDIATLAKPFQDEDIFCPNSVKLVVNNRSKALYFSRSAIPFIRNSRQEKWKTHHLFLKHIGLYGYKTNVLKEIALLPPTPLEEAESLEQLRWLENGYSISVGITQLESISIDTPEDLKRAEKYLAEQYP